MRILCIDDDTTFLSLYQSVLEQILLPEDELLLSNDAEEGIELMLKKPADIVITDLVMPGKNGIEILENVKSFNSRTEVIVVTGQGSIDSAVEAMRLGARDYLSKPLNHGMLVEKIENIRELIGRIKEVEDYRFAKETVEINAERTIITLEMRLTAATALLSELKTYCVSSGNGSSIAAYLINRIEAFEKEQTV